MLPQLDVGTFLLDFHRASYIYVYIPQQPQPLLLRDTLIEFHRSDERVLFLSFRFAIPSHMPYTMKHHFLYGFGAQILFILR